MTGRELARGVAKAPGAATIVNAMATGRGAAFAIRLRVVAKVRLNDSRTVKGRIVDEPEADAGLIERCVRGVLRSAGADYGALVETNSDLPMARGLSSSSACSNAAVLATASALRKMGFATPSDEELLGLGIDASVESGVTVTGAFDDASASLYGGFVVTDNTTRRIIRRGDMPDLEVAVMVPERKSYSGAADVDTMKLFAPQVEIAHREAVEGDLLRAMTLNGLIYCASTGQDPLPAVEALRAGALAAGLTGKGPAFVALAEDARKIAERWKEMGWKVILTRTDNDGSKVLE